MIDLGLELPVSDQCRLLSLARSTYYYEGAGETPENLALMELIDRLDFSKLESTGYSALPELLLLIDGVGATIVEVPITFVERERGATKLTKRELAKSLANVVRMRRRRVARSRAQRRAGATGKGAR